MAHQLNEPALPKSPVLGLVEVVGGEQTDPEAVRRAVDFYTALGKKPRVLHKEVPGFVANRLQAALFREAVNLVLQGVVTEKELDEIVTSSIGLRWAVAGPFRSFHLGGGPGGLPAFLEHLGPALESQWRDLGAPILDEATVKFLSAQADADFGATTIEEMQTARDAAQIKVMRALDGE
ncbi:3-hydroxyacyl-CoA dehydrogenase family protein [Streptomyces sp. NPDC051658]|uniref:3-hydroxyacyl-CoA dehydrogenase family protein n=1 Tax=Streptomyces sp. NPDC051658 TaxID=3365667 RepID=UPI0037883679